MHVLQIWAFETLSILANTGLCSIIEGRENVIPRTLKWAFQKKPFMELFCDLIFDNDEFEWKSIVPTAQEMENIQGVAEARLLDEELGLLQVIKADGKEKRKNEQVAAKGNGKLRTKEVVVNTKKGKFASKKGKTHKDKPECSSKASKGKASKETDEDESYEESEEETSKRGVKKMMLRRFDHQVKQIFKMMAELRDLKNKQNNLEVMLTKLIQLVKELSKNVKKMNTEGKASRAEELMDGNKAGSEKQTESINNNGLDAEATNEEPPKQPQVQDEATDNVVIPTPCSGPGFKISNMEAETEESGSSENEGVLQQNIDLDKNKNGEQIAMDGNGSKSTVGDTQEEVQEKINDKEEEARLNRSGYKENEKTKTNSGAEKREMTEMTKMLIQFGVKKIHNSLEICV
ncbi:unnamed protein product [Cuscuta europaea]|uniref:Uncharacterized protein n=1 Tax=Cuscuta europaea TaxID=41803 RepID=A0A9P0Z4D5_CUSEU|nr:unnamed protein product [Cuscuta europaea]